MDLAQPVHCIGIGCLAGCKVDCKTVENLQSFLIDTIVGVGVDSLGYQQIQHGSKTVQLVTELELE